MASIVVVGAGVAGLACAWRLQQRGFAVEVLEGEPESGGRLRVKRVAGQRLECGAVSLRDADGAARRLATRVGLTPRPLGGATALLEGGRLHAVAPERPLRGAPALPVAARLGLARLAARVAAFSGDPSQPQAAASLDRELPPGTLRRLAGEEAWARWVEVLLVEAGSPAALVAGDAFQLSLLARARAGLGRFGFEGGVARLASALGRSVPVRTGCRVESVESESGGVRVSYRASGRLRRAVADAGVIALPADRVAVLCPKLTPHERGFFAGVRYRRALVLHLLLEERPALRAARVLFSPGGGIPAVQLGAEVTDAGAHVRIELHGSAVDRFWDAPAGRVEAWLREALAGAALRLPVASQAMLHRFEAGHPVFGPGRLEALARFANRVERSPRLAFAGDALGGPHLEGALRSGLEAAEAIERELAG